MRETSPDPTLQRKILDELEDGPRSFEELRTALLGCGDCGRYDKEDELRFDASWKGLHDDQKVHLTVDRRLGMGPPAALRDDT